MAIKPRAKGIPPLTKYSDLHAFAISVIISLTGNANFPVPAPILVALGALEVTLAAEIAAWGPVGARGSHTDLMNLRSAALAMRNALVQEQGYVQGVCSGLVGDYAFQAAVMSGSGFGVKNAGIPQGVLAAVENFHQFFKANVSPFHVGLDWEKPLGLTSKGNVKLYRVWKNISLNNFNDPGTLVIGTTTKTRFIDPTFPVANPSYYWITPVNYAGDGAPSNAVPVAPLT